VDKAVVYLPKAGEKAKQRYANEAAITYFRQTLELLDRLPDNPERARQELMLQLSLGAPLIAARGYAAPEVEQTFARARALCEDLGETHLLFPVLRGLWLYYCVRADHPTAWKLAEELGRLAEAGQNPAFLLGAHLALGTTSLWMGELRRAQEHHNQTITHYDPQRHRSLALIFGTDPGSVSRSYEAWSLWVLGYPDQALKLAEEAVALAQERNGERWRWESPRCERA
jgi:predicted ATPase